MTVSSNCLFTGATEGTERLDQTPSGMAATRNTT